MTHEFVPHVFAQGHTIEGAIRLHNSLTMLPEHIEVLVDEFNQINQDVFPPVAGQVVKIPVMADYKFEPILEPEPVAPKKVEPIEPIIEVELEVPRKLPPLRLPMRPVIRQPPKKRDPKKKVNKKLHWWK